MNEPARLVDAPRVGAHLSAEDSRRLRTLRAYYERTFDRPFNQSETIRQALQDAVGLHNLTEQPVAA